MRNPAVPGNPKQPMGEPIDEEVQSEPLGDANVRVENAPAGPRSLGGGEFPDPDTPPSGSAPADGSPPRRADTD